MDMKVCDSGEFKDKVAIITGAGRGIGKGLARALAVRGCAVGLLGMSEGPVRKVAEELNAEGFRALGIACDVADEVGVAAAVATVIDTFGGVDILINNAGLHSAAYNKGFGELGLVEARRLFDVNVMGIVICSLACRSAMIARGKGVILNISSVGGYLNSNAYGVSKLATRGLTVSLATEFAPDRIRVNGIAPGLIATEQIREDYSEERLQTHVQTLQKVEKLGTPEDIANAMLYFCSDRSSFVTGETLKVSGGYPLFI